MDLIGHVEREVPAMAARAAWLDGAAAFPAEDIARLRDIGALAEPGGAGGLLRMLRALGRGNLSVARLFEAHVNALRLIARFGDEPTRHAAAADAHAGHLFGLWVTDAPGHPVSARADRLSGAKGPCSGAGHCTRALVTAEVDGGTRMAAIVLTGSEPVTPIAGGQGMRAATNGIVDLSGVAVGAWVGEPGAYLDEPEFSCGAWRASAAAAGALEALVAAVATVLRARGQAEAPLQLARFGAMVAARETALMWVARMAEAAESEAEITPSARVAAVNLGRGVVERACLDAIELAQRSVGMAAFVAPAPVDRITRDLGIYLRQPAVDAVLLEAAAWHLERC